jgi:tetratricopeptide (TPR) repeat protein
VGEPEGRSPAWERVDALFDQALELPEGERGAFLAAVTTEDASLGAELGALLGALVSAPTDFLAEPASAEATTLLGYVAARTDPSASLGSAGTRIGPWRVVAPLGEGGMGRVVVAERDDGHFDQQVALKLLRPGFVSHDLVARFLQERQILARLEHPAIARLLDGGITPDGQPYFALELVRGEPLSRWCRHRRAPLATRLQLLGAVAEAVAYAHTRLVVHRDLKPSNVWVADDGSVKLLDFGIAKLLDPTASPGHTRTELRLLTPEYAAPEQILGDAISTATDVYALGVMLFELLTGELPHQRTGQSSGELVRNLDNEAAERPSTVAARRLPQLAPTLADGEATTWPRRLRGDLDAITLMALRREPDRRYASAAALAEDLRRFLAGEAVTAGPDTFGYRAGKWLGRHWRAATAAAVAVLSLGGGLAVALQQATVARRAQQRAERSAAFIASLFEQAEPSDAESANRRAVDLIADGVRQAEGMAGEDPELAADLLATLVPIELTLGRVDDAERHAEQVLAERVARTGPTSPTTAVARHALGDVLVERGDYEQAEVELAAALKIFAAREGEGSEAYAGVLASQAALASERDDWPTADRLFARAEALLVPRLGPNHERVLSLRRRRAFGLITNDRTAEAVEVLRALVAAERAQAGPDSVRLAYALHDLGIALHGEGLAHQATEDTFAEAIAILRRVLGNHHPRLAATLRQYADFLSTRARFAEADTALAEAETILRQEAPDGDALAFALNARAILQWRLGRHREAAELEREVVARFERALGPTHSTTLSTLSNLGAFLTAAGDLAAGESVLREVVARHRASAAGTLRAELGYALNNLGGCLTAQQRPAEAVPLHREAQAIADQLHQGPHDDRVTARMNVAEALLEMGRGPGLSEARALAAEAVAMQRTIDPTVPRLAGALSVAARIALAEGRIGDAEGWLGEARAIQLARRGPESIHVAALDVHLARCAAARGQRSEAQALVARVRPAVAAAGAGFRSLQRDLARLEQELARQ